MESQSYPERFEIAIKLFNKELSTIRVQQELKKKVELLSSYTTECIEHNDEVSFVQFPHRLAGTGKHGAEEGERPIEE